jgi:branched-chain amino acid transport system substrate-binding protein
MLSVCFAGSAEKIKVASIFEKTGSGSTGNEATIEGIRFAVQELNRQGGLQGKQIELLEFDNKSSTIYSKLVAQRAVKAGVITVFGANWSSNSLAMAPVLQKAKIPMISPFSTNPDVTLVGDFIFRICFTDSFQGLVAAKFAFQDLNAQTAAILINANSRYSEGFAKFFKQSFKKQSGKILLEASYLEDTDDFSLYLKKIKLLQPDIVFLPGHTTDAGKIIRQSREQGMSITFLGGDAWGDTMYSHTGSSLHGNYYSAHWHHNNQNIESLQFVKKYQDNFGGMISDAGPALTYDAVFLFADAVRRAKSLKPTKIKNALTATKNYKGITGNITFNDNGDPIKPAVILKFDKGTSIYVKTVVP